MGSARAPRVLVPRAPRRAAGQRRGATRRSVRRHPTRIFGGAPKTTRGCACATRDGTLLPGRCAQVIRLAHLDQGQPAADRRFFMRIVQAPEIRVRRRLELAAGDFAQPGATSVFEVHDSVNSLLRIFSLFCDWSGPGGNRSHHPCRIPIRKGPMCEKSAAERPDDREIGNFPAFPDSSDRHCTDAQTADVAK